MTVIATTAATAGPTKLITAEELWAMGDIGRCELIYGELIMMSPASANHGVVAARFVRLLGNFVEEHELGLVFGTETGFTLEPNLVRAPDAAFIPKERLKMKSTGFYNGAPDLAVEVISPGDTQREVNEKLHQWLAYGVRSVWIADPLQKTITVHRVGQPRAVFSQADTLTDEVVLPGFSLSVERLFRLP
jgi:Uma2 family endonuclease